MADPNDLPRLIFTVTAGRTGTTLLTRLLGLLPGVCATHEPEPNFVHAMRSAQLQPALAEAFVQQVKLPVIRATGHAIYAEMSHLTCKGFVEPLLAATSGFGLIFLCRSPSEIAYSLLSRNSVPGRTNAGLLYLVHPDDPGVLPLPGWKSAMSDYQLCYWYALEIERRQIVYAKAWEALGLPAFGLETHELTEFATFQRLCAALDLPLPSGLRFRQQYEEVVGRRHNPNQSYVDQNTCWAEEEAQVWRVLQASAPGVVQELAQHRARSEQADPPCRVAI